MSESSAKFKHSTELINYSGSEFKVTPPLGPLYELETSSPAAALKPAETMRHVRRTFHIQGSEEELDPLTRRLLGASLDAIKSAS